MKIPYSTFLRATLVLLASGCCLLPARAASDEDSILAAREAFRNGSAVKLARARAALRGSPLDVWAEYYQLRLALDGGETTGIGAFLQHNEGSYLAEKLRADWLRAAAQREQWDAVQREYLKLLQPETDMNCLSLQARLLRGEAVARSEARNLFLSVNELPDACRGMSDALMRSGVLSEEDVWLRIRRAFEQKKLAQARDLGRYLPEAQAPDARALAPLGDRPARYLDKLPADFAKTRLARELLIYALQLQARNDTADAIARWNKLAPAFSAEERAYAAVAIGMIAAQKHAPAALALFKGAGNVPMSEEQHAWHVRAALRAGDWAEVRRAILLMPASQAAQIDWEYWLGRALQAQGQADEARAHFQKIALDPSFYGNLAADELGIPITAPPLAAQSSTEELQQARGNPALARALVLIGTDMRSEGVREWNWTLRTLNDRQLLAAAELARRAGVYDRSIAAALRTQREHDYTLRFPAPYSDQVRPKAREQGLDDAWVYGLMRQESRFVMQARSNVGAQGLMQVMPATAKWVAKKIGLADYSHQRAGEMATNITLGTNYMRMVLAGLDNQPVLASAAYNAGPGRARRWCAERPLEGAIYVETIPFSETRDYVKKVMSNTVYYAALFNERPQSLKSRLGTIKPRIYSDSGADALP